MTNEEGRMTNGGILSFKFQNLLNAFLFSRHFTHNTMNSHQIDHFQKDVTSVDLKMAEFLNSSFVIRHLSFDRLIPGEIIMVDSDKKRQTFIIDLEKLNTLNAEGCMSCGRKFNLGETVVKACGAWEGPPKFIHENEAVWDVNTATFMERRCYQSRKEG